MLTSQGVAGVEDFGRFVSNVSFFGASAFDERAAMTILINALPRVRDARLADTIASHLRRPWARPAAYESLLDAFKRFGGRNGSSGWSIGDSLASAATANNVATLLGLVSDPHYGEDRQMIVYSLHRYKSADGVAATLQILTRDPDVSRHAISAYRRVVGDAAARGHLETLRKDFKGTAIAKQAEESLRKIDNKSRKSISS